MIRFLSTIMLSVALVGPTAFAQSDLEEDMDAGTAGTADTAEGTTVREVTEADKGVYDSPIGITPRLGVVGFSDIQDEYTTRAAAGISLQWNAFGHFETEPLKNVQLGIESGFLYSHIGAPGSGFFGADDEVTQNVATGGNAVFIPGHLMAGYRFGDAAMVSALVGTQLIYRSQNLAMKLGRDDNTLNDSAEFFPSLGLAAGWEVSDMLAINLRGDYIPTPVDDLFTASLGATIPLG